MTKTLITSFYLELVGHSFMDQAKVKPITLAFRLYYYAADSAAGRAAFPYAQNAQSRRLPQPAISLDAGRVASVLAETDTRGGGRYARITKRGVRSPRVLVAVHAAQRKPRKVARSIPGVVKEYNAQSVRVWPQQVHVGNDTITRVITVDADHIADYVGVGREETRNPKARVAPLDLQPAGRKALRQVRERCLGN